MLDKYLEIAHREQEKLASRDNFVELMMKLPDDELHEMAATGIIKVGYFGESAILGDGGDRPGWLDHFKGTPLMPQAIALLEEELKAQAAEDQDDMVRSQDRQQKNQQRDALRLQKRLLELELVKSQEAAMSAAQPPPEPSPGMGAPPGMGAQGAGAPGDMASEGAVDGNPQKMAAAKEEHRDHHRTHRDGEVLGRHLDTVGALGGVYHGAQKGHEIGKSLGHGPKGRLATAAGGAVLGGLAGHGVGKFTQGVIHGAAHSEERDKHAGGVGEFLHAAAPAVASFVKEHPGAAIGGGLGALHGLLHQGGGVGSALLEGAGGAALGHGAQHMYESGALRGVRGEQTDIPKTSTVAKEAAALPPFAGSEKQAFGALIGALGGALAGAGARAGLAAAAKGAAGMAAKGVVGAAVPAVAAGAEKGLMSGGMKGIATTGMNWLKANPMKAAGGAMNAAANFAQARNQGQGMGGAALSGLAGGASALG